MGEKFTEGYYVQGHLWLRDSESQKNVGGWGNILGKYHLSLYPSKGGLAWREVLGQMGPCGLFLDSRIEKHLALKLAVGHDKFAIYLCESAPRSHCCAVQSMFWRFERDGTHGPQQVGTEDSAYQDLCKQVPGDKAVSGEALSAVPW